VKEPTKLGGFNYVMMMIAFITIKSSLVPLIEGLCVYETGADQSDVKRK